MTARLVGRAALLAALLVAAWAAASAEWSPADLRVALERMGAWAPAAFVLAFALGTVLFLPGTIFSLAGGALFGPVLGSLLNLAGATIGATVAFLVARGTAAEWMRARMGPRLSAVVDGVETEGWRFVAFVRLVPLFPFNVVNYAFGLTRIGTTAYVVTTALCMIPGAVAYTYLGYAGREAAAGAEDTIEKLLLAVALVAVTAFLPRLVRRMRARARPSRGEEREARRDAGTPSARCEDPMPDSRLPPILDLKAPGQPSVFRPENMLREARRQKGLAEVPVPAVCLLDPDGDILRHLRDRGLARPHPGWACYHTGMDVFLWEGVEFGIVASAVGASFAVLLAEQMFASGCRLLLSMTSSGQIAPAGPTPYFVLIERALRDEGTSYHYLPPSRFSEADPALAAIAADAVAGLAQRVHRGATWTTDAPFRETEAAVAAHRAAGILAVEMEAAALYAFARATTRPVLCFAHVTNQMAQNEGDFEKGEADGAVDALAVLAAAASAVLPRLNQASEGGEK